MLALGGVPGLLQDVLVSRRHNTRYRIARCQSAAMCARLYLILYYSVWLLLTCHTVNVPEIWLPVITDSLYRTEGVLLDTKCTGPCCGITGLMQLGRSVNRVNSKSERPCLLLRCLWLRQMVLGPRSLATLIIRLSLDNGLCCSNGLPLEP